MESPKSPFSSAWEELRSARLVENAPLIACATASCTPEATAEAEAGRVEALSPLACYRQSRALLPLPGRFFFFYFSR